MGQERGAAEAAAATEDTIHNSSNIKLTVDVDYTARGDLSFQSPQRMMPMRSLSWVVKFPEPPLANDKTIIEIADKVDEDKDKGG